MFSSFLQLLCVEKSCDVYGNLAGTYHIWYGVRWSLSLHTSICIVHFFNAVFSFKINFLQAILIDSKVKLTKFNISIR